MCGRFDLHLPREAIAGIFGITIVQDIQPRYNIAPTQQVVVIRTYPDATRHLDLLKWGLIPSWAKDPSIGSRMINARSETVDVKPAFRTALKHRRCIIPANGFYEWREVSGKKHPLYVKLKSNDLMMFAGLWDHWKSPEGEVIESCTILTTTTNDLIKPLHDRMPVILEPKDIDLWLDHQVADPEQLKPLFKPYFSEHMEMHPVSDLVNSPRNETSDLIKPLEAM
jgi:putative SOS response-associated peptidase YedK